MCEDWEPFLSLDEADGEGPGEACDLGTVLARHSLVAWMVGFEVERQSVTMALPFVTVALEVSHDAVRWHEIGKTSVGRDAGGREIVGCWPHPYTNYANAWPARYVRAKITTWPKNVTAGLVSATIASA